jgi:hypothetical protein
LKVYAHFNFFCFVFDADIAYLRDSLMCFESDAVAAARMRELIGQCLNTRTTQLNDAAHLLKHA